MKTSIATTVALLSLAMALNAYAQPVPHHFSGIGRLADGTLELSLDGSVSNMLNLSGTISNQFMQMSDMYLVESSPDLKVWRPFASLLRTNNDPAPLRFRDTNAANLSGRFYRTPTNHLVTAFPKPSGPFTVGTVDRVMVDPARTNRYRHLGATNAFMVTFWYPADPAPAGALPAAMWDRRVAADANLYTFAAWDFRWALVAPKLRGHGFRGLPLPAGTGTYPVILCSHGLPAFRKISSHAYEEWASHGYVVVAIDHNDCWATEFPDGRYLATSRGGDVPGRLKDMQFLLDELAALNAGDPMFAGRLDLDRIGVYGFSYGGMVVETCRTDGRVKCAVVYDAGNVDLNSSGLQKPFMFLLGESNGAYNEGQWLFSRAQTNALFVQIRGGTHGSDSDAVWTARAPKENGPALAIDACRVWFFDTYLRGETPPFPGNPEIYNVQRK